MLKLKKEPSGFGERGDGAVQVAAVGEVEMGCLKIRADGQF